MSEKILIVSGGRIDTEFMKEYLGKHTFSKMIAVDAGMEFFKESEYLPDFIIGDFDSVSGDTLNYFEEKNIEIRRLIPEKDDTDTEAAIRWAIAGGASEIHLLGATGSRLDHVLGNIELLGIGLQERVPIFLVDANNRIRMTQQTIELTKAEQYGKYVSLIPFSAEVTGVTLTGMKYPLTDYTLKSFNSLGVSNEITEEKCRIEMREGILLIIESRD